MKLPYYRWKIGYKLPNTVKTKKYLDALPKIYSVVLRVNYSVDEHYFSGQFEKISKIGNKKVPERLIPLVWNYYDGNGVFDEYRLYKLNNTTSGTIIMWTYDKSIAEHIAKSLNKYECL